MEGNSFFRNSQIVVLGFSIAAATIIASLIFSQAAMKVMRFNREVISVTGAADKNINSDFMVWKLSYSRRDATLKGAFALLREDLKAVKAYLLDKNIPEQEIIVGPVRTEILYKRNEKGNNTNEIEAYLLTQDIEVRSNAVERVTQISRESTELIDQGIELISNAPEYFYTKLAELKIEMLRAATQDAKRRAEEIASSSGNRIGAVRSARMGVFQITPANSFDVSDWGTNDTSSYEKKVNAVVKADFAIA